MSIQMLRLEFHQRLRMKIKDERGSLSILSTSLFFLLVITSFVILNTSSAFVAKRELIQISETALTKSVHALNTGNYYAGGTSTYSNQFTPGAYTNSYNSYPSNSTYSASVTDPVTSSYRALPIDCAKALQTFTDEMSRATLRSKSIGVSEWSCDGYQASAMVTVSIRQLLTIPFLATDSEFTISASISALNRLQ